MAARKPAAGLVKVTVAAPFQVNHQGKVYGPGEQVIVSVELADKWEASNLVTR